MISLIASGFLGTMLSILFVIVCFLLIFMVIITPSNDGGMAATFGGMGSDSFFGTKAHQHINKFTVFLAVAFLGLAFWINFLNKEVPSGSSSTPGKTLEQKVKELPPTPKSPGTNLPPSHK